ncbi:hypothetical protein OE88DRAFT_1735413 [Heliocybe sulcata]|uniref:DUF6534 domain-containing protein n=1 Tax=Heliocybe sulcata TaxID=5364 RepID=A0A5C3NCB3_9AGAM|nr:hypothetical protein OE88DRAFT_1735413 [Heliocybe sulcata]
MSIVYLQEYIHFRSEDPNTAAGDTRGRRLLGILVIVGQTSALVTDLGMIIGMYYVLYNARRRAPKTSRPMKYVLSAIVAYTIATGLLTCVISSCILASYVLFPGTMVPIAFVFVNGRLYVNSMLAALNGRDLLRARLGTVVDLTVSYTQADVLGLEIYAASSSR